MFFNSDFEVSILNYKMFITCLKLKYQKAYMGPYILPLNLKIG